MKNKIFNQRGFSHILILIFILVIFVASGLIYLRARNAADSNKDATIKKESGLNAQAIPDGPMILDEKIFSSLGLKFVGDKNKLSDIIIVVPYVSTIREEYRDKYVYGYYDNETTGENGSIVVLTRKNELKPSSINAITKDLIDYGKTLKTKEEKDEFSYCITSPHGGNIVFMTRQEYDEDQKVRAEIGGPGRGQGKFIGDTYVYYQNATGGCADSDVAGEVSENIISTAQYIIDNLRPLN